MHNVKSAPDINGFGLIRNTPGTVLDSLGTRMIARKRSRMTVGPLSIASVILPVAVASMLTIFGASVGLGTTLRVPADHATIDDGIVAAQPGDTVLVAPGVYSGPGNRSLSLYGKDIVLMSEAGPEQTTIDVQANFSAPARGLLIDGGESPAAVVDGFTIINGFMSTQPDFAPTANVHDLSGGGFKVNLQSKPTIRNMIVRNCHSEYTGGGVSIEIQSAPTLIGCLIESCTAGIQGGGISIESGSAPVLEACVFTGNRSLIGGGMFTDVAPFVGPSLVVVDCTIAANFAQHRGGGIFCSVSSKSRFERITVWGNCAVEVGPEIAVEFGGNATFACSIIDTSGVYSEGVIEYEEDNLLGIDPGFCEPDTCTEAPSTVGDYGVGDLSRALARSSPCGARIGGIGRGACGSTNPVVETSWGKVKGAFGRSRGSSK